MAGSCIINGVDIANLGMFILRGGDNDLIAFPERKEPKSNDWFEQDGLDVDLSEIYFNAKKVTIKCYLNAATTHDFLTNLNAFKALITSSENKSIYLREFNKTFLLRYVSCQQFTFKGGLIKTPPKSAEIDVQFSDDTPLSIFDTTILDPVSTKVQNTYVWLNHIELKNFGIIVKNIYNSALQISDSKPGLIITTERSNGVTAYTGSNVKSKKITIDCVMLAESLNEFYTNYNALFNKLSKTEALSLQIADGNDISCYYSNMTGFTKIRPFSNGIAISFSLVFETVSFVENYFVIEAEDGCVFVTEDNIYIPIDYE